MAMEEKLDFDRKFKYVEKSGTAIGDMLISANPWAGKCSRENCFPCTTGDESGKCTRQGAIYQIECLKCKAEGAEAHYWGETARTCFDRGAEHLGGIKAKSEDSTFWRHHKEVHGEDTDPQFSMRVKRTLKGNLQRQALEGRLIDSFKGQYPLNNKGEWGHNLAPKLQIEGHWNGKRSGAKDENPKPAKKKRKSGPEVLEHRETEIADAKPAKIPEDVESQESQAKTKEETPTFGNIQMPESSQLPKTTRKPLTVKQILARMHLPQVQKK